VPFSVTQPSDTLTSMASAGTSTSHIRIWSAIAANVGVFAGPFVEQADVQFVTDVVVLVDVARVGDSGATLPEAADGAAQSHDAVFGEDGDLRRVRDTRVVEQRRADVVFEGWWW